MNNIGIDVAKSKLDICILPNNTEFQVPNNQEGIKQLLKRIKNLDIELIVVEASGGYQNHVVYALAKIELPVVVINPRSSKSYARAKGILAKTDRIDAKLLAQFARDMKPEVRPIPTEQMRSINAIMGRRQQLIHMRTAEKNRLQQAHESIKLEIEEHIQWLSKQIKKLDNDLDRNIQQTPLFREKEEILRSVPGIGSVVSRTLLFRLPELGLVNRHEIASLVGVAPFNYDSGDFTGKRIVWGGRTEVRSTLYMATISALRFNPTIKKFYERLLSNNKPKKVAIVACMRKLLTILNSIIYSRTSWNPDYS